jgi:nucleoside 2-deoxyribosyltransferase
MPVFLWSSEPHLLEERTPGADGRDPDGWLMESFGLAENLMIAVGMAPVTSSFEAALRQVKARLLLPA